jgi:hypothetical protein
MAAGITLPALVLRDAILRIAPQDEGSENRRAGSMSINLTGTRPPPARRGKTRNLKI